MIITFFIISAGISGYQWLELTKPSAFLGWTLLRLRAPASWQPQAQAASQLSTKLARPQKAKGSPFILLSSAHGLVWDAKWCKSKLRFIWIRTNYSRLDFIFLHLSLVCDLFRLRLLPFDMRVYM